MLFCSIYPQQHTPTLQCVQRILTTRRLHSTQSMKMDRESMLLKQGRDCKELHWKMLLLMGTVTLGESK